MSTRPPHFSGGHSRPTTPQAPAFTAGNVPLRTTPRLPNAPRSAHGQLPYTRPTGGHGLENSATLMATGATAGPSIHAVVQLCQQLIDEVRRNQEEIKRISEDTKKMVKMIGKLDDNYKKLK